MQKPKVIDGATAGLEFQDSSTEAALDGTIVRAGFQNDNFGNLYDVIEKAGYTLIDDDLSQIHKALRGLYVADYVYNTSAIATQTVNDIVLGSNNIYYEAQSDGISGDDPESSVTGNWKVFIQVSQSSITKTANYTASNGDFILADTSSGTFTITLPDTPTSADKVTIHDAKGTFDTNNLIVARNGQTIMGLAEDMTLKIENNTTEFIFSGTDWRKL